MTSRSAVHRAALAVLVVLAVTAGACTRRQPPVARPLPPPPPSDAARPPAPPEPVAEPATCSGRASDGRCDRIGVARRSEPQLAAEAGVLRAGSNEVDTGGQQVLQGNAEVLKKYPTWQVTIEGHCDERGTAEYNLALGERRAVAARTYLVSLGIPADRIKRSATARNSRSIRATTKRRGRRTAAPTSS